MTVDDLRRKLTDEYAEERFTMTAGDIARRAGRGSRRRWGAWAVATTAAVLAAGFVIWPRATVGRVEPLATPTPTTSAAQPWRATFEDRCRAKWLTRDRTELEPQDRDQLPPLRFDLAHGELGIRVYGNERVVVDCEHTFEGDISIGISWGNTPSKLLMPDRGAHLPRSGTVAHLGDGPINPAADYYLGRVPAGVTRIDAVGRQGQVMDAVIDGDMFLLWAPEGGLNHAVFRAYTAETVLVDGHAVYPEGPYREAGVDRVCKGLAGDYSRLAGAPPLQPRRFVLRDGDQAKFVYAGDGMVSVCSHHPNEVSLVSVVRTGAAWEPMRIAYRAGWREGWVVGLAPPGARSGRVFLPGGRTVPVRFSGGWFVAQWKLAKGDFVARPEKVEVVTASEVWTERGGQVSRRAR